MIAYFYGATGADGASPFLQGLESAFTVGQSWGRLGATGAAAPTAPS